MRQPSKGTRISLLREAPHHSGPPCLTEEATPPADRRHADPFRHGTANAGAIVSYYTALSPECQSAYRFGLDKFWAGG